MLSSKANMIIDDNVTVLMIAQDMIVVRVMIRKERISQEKTTSTYYLNQHTNTREVAVVGGNRSIGKVEHMQINTPIPLT